MSSNQCGFQGLNPCRSYSQTFWQSFHFEGSFTFLRILLNKGWISFHTSVRLLSFTSNFRRENDFGRNPIWNLSVLRLGILVSASLTLSLPPPKLFRVKLLSSLFPTDVFLAPFPHQRHFFLVKTLPIITFDQILFLCDPPLYHQGRKYVARPGILDMPWPFKVESGRMTHCCMWLKGGW